MKKVFKEEWVAQFSWVEPVVDLTSKIHMVHYKVCSLVEGKDKILNLKMDGSQKHVGKRKALIFHLGVLAGSLISTMTDNTKEMKGLMLVGV
jgi:hypothetical protein